MGRNIAIKHSGFMGDIVASLPAIQSASKIHNSKVDLYLFLNRSWSLYSDESRPHKGLLDHECFNFLKPLLSTLPYIGEVKEWTGEKIDYDFDIVKHLGTTIGLPHSNISRWAMYVYPNLQCDISLPSIEHTEVVSTYLSKESSIQYLNSVVSKASLGVLVNRSMRWQNPHINYVFLNNLENTPVYFIGRLDEYELFMNQVPKAEHISVKSALEMALWISNSKLFIGNQSLAYNIAEQMKTIRLLECCSEATNVMPVGFGGYDFYTQHGLETLVNQLITEKQS